MIVTEPLISTLPMASPESTFNPCQRLLESQFRPCIEETPASTEKCKKLPRKVVRWNPSVMVFNDTPTQHCQARIEKMRQHETSRAKNKSPPPPVTPDELHRQMDHLQYKIYQAVRLELKLLNDAKEARDKLARFVAMHKVMNGEDFLEKLESKKRSMTPEDRTEHVQKLEAKVHKATQVEKSFLQKSKEIRRKRYRLTKLYEFTSEELQRQSAPSGGDTASKIQLPPIFPSANLSNGDANEQSE